MATKYLIILVIGHLLGDFYLQNDKIAKFKEEQFKGVLLHGLEYYLAFLLTILPVLSLDMVIMATYAAIVHLLIDTGKYLVLKCKKTKKTAMCLRLTNVRT